MTYAQWPFFSPIAVTSSPKSLRLFFYRRNYVRWYNDYWVFAGPVQYFCYSFLLVYVFLMDEGKGRHAKRSFRNSSFVLLMLRLFVIDFNAYVAFSKRRAC